MLWVMSVESRVIFTLVVLVFGCIRPGMSVSVEL